MKHERVLIVMAKSPELGKVKTRLARSVGDEKALAIYYRLLDHTLQLAGACDAHAMLYYTDPDSKNLPASDLPVKRQGAGNLGDKMREALVEELGHFNKACIIGTDCVQLTKHHLTTAFDQLEIHDFVLGPANDGGYYLLGMKQPEATLFENMPWSTAQVLSETTSRIKVMNKTYFLLPELIDVDNLEDWESVRKKFK